MDHVSPGHRPRSFTICVTLTLASCGSPIFRPATDLTVDIDDETAIPTEDSVPADVLLISDTHASNPMAPHALLSDGYYADTYVTEVAIRPPHMDQWGSRMVDWVLDQPRSARTIIHLGDAGNIGCVGDLQQHSRSRLVEVEHDLEREQLHGCFGDRPQLQARVDLEITALRGDRGVADRGEVCVIVDNDLYAVVWEPQGGPAAQR
jgi:hypothetical protein